MHPATYYTGKPYVADILQENSMLHWIRPIVKYNTSSLSVQMRLISFNNAVITAINGLLVKYIKIFSGLRLSDFQRVFINTLYVIYT